MKCFEFFRSLIVIGIASIVTMASIIVDIYAVLEHPDYGRNDRVVIGIQIVIFALVFGLSVNMAMKPENMNTMNLIYSAVILFCTLITGWILWMNKYALTTTIVWFPSLVVFILLTVNYSIHSEL